MTGLRLRFRSLLQKYSREGLVEALKNYQAKVIGLKIWAHYGLVGKFSVERIHMVKV